MSVKELRQAVADLPPDQLERFSVWFDRFREEVEEDIAAGRTRPL